MNLHTMDYFIVLADEKSFTRAAEKLNITQQTLSAHVAQLEKELGNQLIIRSVPLGLTYAGEVFLNYAKNFQTDLRNMEKEFTDIADNKRGRLKVGIAATRGHIVMPRAIAQFQSEFPDITIDLHEGENTALIEQLKAGDLDMVVAHVPPNQPSLVVKKLYREEIILMAPESLLTTYYGTDAEAVIERIEKTQSLKPMEDFPFMLVGKRDVSGDIARQVFERSGISPRITVLSRNAETLLALAERGVGACFTPGELVETMFPEGSNAGLRCIHLGKQAFYDIHAAWRGGERLWSATESFYNTLDSQLEDTVWVRSHV